MRRPSHYIPEALMVGFGGAAVAFGLLAASGKSWGADIYAGASARAEVSENPPVFRAPAPRPRPRKPAPPIPPRRPAVERPVPAVIPVPPAPTPAPNPALRHLYLRCYSFFTLYAALTPELGAEVVDVIKVNTRALLRAALVLTTDEDRDAFLQESEAVFTEVLQEYVTAAERGDRTTVEDRYSAPCTAQMNNVLKAP